MPPSALRLLGLLNTAVAVMGAAVADDPGLLTWFAAALASMARTSDELSDKTFDAISQLVFGEGGPTAPAPPTGNED